MPSRMSVVKGCNARDCAYNVNEACHALAITVGEGADPICDTFFPSPVHGVAEGISAGVGACKVGHCRYNAGLECVAGTITVGMEVHPEKHHADCMTFEPR
ncbi:MAG: DUF1540 domain-containing protein [Deltaproteobacteria bacterium]|nr:DUF1540 domain-containing protein [Deltaproteobacteria bacterium]